MARIDRRRLDAAAFPTCIEIQTRYDDLDMQGHVNNASATVILQEARARFNRVAGFPELRGDLRAMVAALSIEYAGEMHFPEPVEVSTGILQIGRTSLTLGQVARQGGRAGLYAQTVLVIADDNGPAAIPDALRAAYERFLIRDAEA